MVINLLGIILNVEPDTREIALQNPHVTYLWFKGHKVRLIIALVALSDDTYLTNDKAR